MKTCERVFCFIKKLIKAHVCVCVSYRDGFPLPNTWLKLEKSFIFKAEKDPMGQSGQRMERKKETQTQLKMWPKHTNLHTVALLSLDQCSCFKLQAIKTQSITCATMATWTPTKCIEFWKQARERKHFPHSAQLLRCWRYPKDALNVEAEAAVKTSEIWNHLIRVLTLMHRMWVPALTSSSASFR